MIPAVSVPVGLGAAHLLQDSTGPGMRTEADLDEQGFCLDGACALTQSWSAGSVI